MNSDVKTKLFANVLLKEEQPAAFKHSRRPWISVNGMAAAAIAFLFAVFAFLMWSKIVVLF